MCIMAVSQRTELTASILLSVKGFSSTQIKFAEPKPRTNHGRICLDLDHSFGSLGARLNFCNMMRLQSLGALQPPMQPSRPRSVTKTMFQVTAVITTTRSHQGHCIDQSPRTVRPIEPRVPTAGGPRKGVPTLTLLAWH